MQSGLAKAFPSELARCQKRRAESNGIKVDCRLDWSAVSASYTVRAKRSPNNERPKSWQSSPYRARSSKGHQTIDKPRVCLAMDLVEYNTTQPKRGMGFVDDEANTEG